MDSKGFNFLHHAVLNNDVESVIFLLSVNVNINSTVHNPTRNTALHFAVKNGSEILVRHLVSHVTVTRSSCYGHVIICIAVGRC